MIPNFTTPSLWSGEEELNLRSRVYQTRAFATKLPPVWSRREDLNLHLEFTKLAVCQLTYNGWSRQRESDSRLGLTKAPSFHSTIAAYGAG